MARLAERGTNYMAPWRLLTKGIVAEEACREFLACCRAHDVLRRDNEDSLICCYALVCKETICIPLAVRGVLGQFEF